MKDVAVLGFSCGFSEISQAISTAKVASDKVSHLVSINGWAPLFTKTPIKEGADKLLATPATALAFYPAVWGSGMFSNETFKVFVTLPAQERVAVVTEFLKGLPNPPAATQTNLEVKSRYENQLLGYAAAIKIQYDVNGRQEAYFNEGSAGRKNFKMPLLAIVGGLDEVVMDSNSKNAVPYAQAYFKTYCEENSTTKNQLVTYPQAGHMIPYEMPDTLASDVHRFITHK